VDIVEVVARHFHPDARTTSFNNHRSSWRRLWRTGRSENQSSG
jgi:hypothetical protein